MRITTITTVVPVVGEDRLQRQLRKLGERDQDLATYARSGWQLVHTATVSGPHFTTFVDTLTQTDECPNGEGANRTRPLPYPDSNHPAGESHDHQHRHQEAHHQDPPRRARRFCTLSSRQEGRAIHQWRRARPSFLRFESGFLSFLALFRGHLIRKRICERIISTYGELKQDLRIGMLKRFVVTPASI